MTARLIIARRVPIYERVVTDVERRRTNSVGDIYNLRGRRVADRTGLEFHSRDSFPKGLGRFPRSLFSLLLSLPLFFDLFQEQTERESSAGIMRRES